MVSAGGEHMVSVPPSQLGRTPTDGYSRVEDHVDDHWRWRPDWAPGRACLWWYLTFEDHPEVADATETLRRRLADHPAADPVPAPWLHLTVCEVAFADRLPAAGVASVADSVREAVAAHHISLELRTVTTMPGAVVLAAGPLGPWRGLAERVRSATEAAGAGPAVAVAESFWPHVTLAYVNRRVSRTALLHDLERDVPEIRVEPRALTLAAVTRRDRHYQWLVHDRAPLGGRPGMSAGLAKSEASPLSR
jgi:2'-5' RNA ligase